MNVFMTDAGAFRRIARHRRSGALRPARARRAARHWPKAEYAQLFALQHASLARRCPCMPVDAALRGARRARRRVPHHRSRAMKRAQAAIEAAIARGDVDERRALAYLAAVRPLFRRVRTRSARASARRRPPARAAQSGPVQSHRRTRRRGQADRGYAAPCLHELDAIAESHRVKVLDRVGRATIGFFEYAGGLTMLSAESVGFIVAAAHPHRRDDFAVRTCSACSR